MSLVGPLGIWPFPLVNAILNTVTAKTAPSHSMPVPPTAPPTLPPPVSLPPPTFPTPTMPTTPAPPTLPPVVVTPTLTIQVSPAPSGGAFIFEVDGTRHVISDPTGPGNSVAIPVQPGNHTISAENFGVVSDARTGCPTTEYQFSSWSNGGPQSQTVDIEADTILMATYLFAKTVC